MNDIARFLCFFALTFSFAVAGQQSQETPAGAIQKLAGKLAVSLSNKNVKSLAVLEFHTGKGKNVSLGGKIGAAGKFCANLTMSAMLKKGKGFAVVSRTEINQVLQEMEFQCSDLVSSSRLAELGKVRSVDALVTGTIIRTGSTALITVKAISVPGARIHAVETGTVKLNSDWAALFGESWYVPPRTDGELDAQKALGRVWKDKEAHPMSDPFSDVPYRMSILVGGKPLPFRRSGNRLYVPAVKGKDYQVKLSNFTEKRVAVALMIDGLSSIGGKLTAPGEAIKWVVKPGQEIVISGWQKDSRTARKFVFTSADRSLAARKNYTDEIGLITAAFYPEKDAAGSDDTTRSAIGTGEGSKIVSKIKRVSMAYDKSTPAAVLGVWYDSKSIVEKLAPVE